MRAILVLNPKGGCGKSTLATNIAGYFASRGKRIALADCDPQGSSDDWLAIRPMPSEAEAEIRRVAATKNARVVPVAGDRVRPAPGGRTQRIQISGKQLCGSLWQALFLML